MSAMVVFHLLTRCAVRTLERIAGQILILPMLDHNTHNHSMAIFGSGQLYGFSRQLRNHAAAPALNYFAYNFIKIHRTLRMSPAMAAGVTDRLWSVEDLVALWEAYEQRRAERAA